MVVPTLNFSAILGAKGAKQAKHDAGVSKRAAAARDGSKAKISSSRREKSPTGTKLRSRGGLGEAVTSRRVVVSEYSKGDAGDRPKDRSQSSSSNNNHNNTRSSSGGSKKKSSVHVGRSSSSSSKSSSSNNVKDTRKTKTEGSQHVSRTRATTTKDGGKREKRWDRSSTTNTRDDGRKRSSSSSSKNATRTRTRTTSSSSSSSSSSSTTRSTSTKEKHQLKQRDVSRSSQRYRNRYKDDQDDDENDGYHQQTIEPPDDLPFSSLRAREKKARLLAEEKEKKRIAREYGSGQRQLEKMDERLYKNWHRSLANVDADAQLQESRIAWLKRRQRDERL